MKNPFKNPAPIAPVSDKKTSVDFKDASSAPSANTTHVKKKGAQAADPTKMAKPSRKFTTATGGARYAIRVKFQKTEAPEAGATQANGRILPSAMGGQAPSFNAGMSDHK